MTLPHFPHHARIFFVMPRYISLYGCIEQARQILKLISFLPLIVIHVEREGEGSWVSMTIDPKNRLIVSDQYGKLFRVTPSPVGGSPSETKVEPIMGGLVAIYNYLGFRLEGPTFGLPVVTASRARLDSVELPPFRASIAAGVGAMFAGDGGGAGGAR